jgi:hypothetical protein
LIVVAQAYSNGDTSNPMALAQYKEIVDTIDYEKNVGETLSLVQMVKTPVARKRMILAISAAVFSTISGKCFTACEKFPLIKAKEMSLQVTTLGPCLQMLEYLMSIPSFK